MWRICFQRLKANKYALTHALRKISVAVDAAGLLLGTLNSLSFRLWVYHPQTRMFV